MNAWICTYTSVYRTSLCMHDTTGLHACQELQIKKLLPELLSRSCSHSAPHCHTRRRQPQPVPGSWCFRRRGSAGLVRAALSAPINRAASCAYKIHVLYNCLRQRAPWQLAALAGLQNTGILYNWASLLRRAQLGVIAQLRGWPTAAKKKSSKVLEKGQLEALRLFAGYALYSCFLRLCAKWNSYCACFT